MRTPNDSSAVTSGDYARAERFLSWNYSRFVLNADIRHHWIGDGDEFWYRRTDGTDGRQFVIVDAATGEVRPAFDHRLVAEGIAQATQREVDPSSLPFDIFSYTHNRRAIEFFIQETSWMCDLASGTCAPNPAVTSRPGEVVSPDGNWAVFLREHNLWLRRIDGGGEHPLTQDGVQRHGYGTLPGITLNWLRLARHGVQAAPEVLWSADSRRLLSYRLDEREVKEAHLVQAVPEDGGMRPKLYSFPYPMPGDDALPRAAPIVFDIESRRQVTLRAPPWTVTPIPPLRARDGWWAADGGTVFLLHRDRYSKTVTLHLADATTGGVRELLRETSAAYVQMRPDLLEPPIVRTLRSGDVLWYSERDGWGNLYRYDGATGKLKCKVTRGKWNVRSIVRVDEEGERIYFTANGREPGDPYRRYLYGVRLDGSDLRLLTPEPADHALPGEGLTLILGRPPLAPKLDRSRFSPSGRYFVDSYSRPDLPPRFLIRTADGDLVKELEIADSSRLEEGGYSPVESFQVLAADGKTPIYGNLFRPSTFDPCKNYPVIDSIYPGPNMARSAKSFGGALYGTFDGFEAQSLAELGFIVVTVDGRGTPLRSRAFLDYSYGRPDKASDLDDHVAALRQLATRYPYMDLNRVGIDGISGGGYATVRALLVYPDFYKVGVSCSGNHEQRAYMAPFWDHFIGPLDQAGYESASNIPLAGRLKGRLMLVTGELDENVHSTMTLRLVNALIRKNRNFDLLVVPNADHGAGLHPYVIRRKWDYFVRNLMGAEPPSAYQVGSR